MSINSPGFKPPRFLWSGNITSFSASIKVKAEPGETFFLSTSSSLDPRLGSTVLSESDARLTDVNISVFPRIAALLFENLQAQTKYYVAVLQANSQSNSAPLVLGVFQTFPKELQPFSFTFSIASCAKWQSVASLSYKEMYSRDPLFYVSTGDLFYADIKTNQKELYAKHYASIFEESWQSRFFATKPVYYIYDDHDWADNDSDSGSKSRDAAQWAFRTFYAHPDLIKVDDRLGSSGVEEIGFQAFTVGRVRFVITDLRSQSSTPDVETQRRTSLGVTQRKLLFQEFRNASSYKLLIWVSSKVWSGEQKDDEKGSWNGFWVERKQIANEISSQNVKNLLMIAGDAHMLAGDTGDNMDFSDPGSGNGAGFPVFQAAPLAQFGSNKGGPYSQGCKAYRFWVNRQYAFVKIQDDQEKTCAIIEGYVVNQAEPAVKLEACVHANDPTSSIVKRGSQTPTVQMCSLPLFPWYAYLCMVVIIVGWVAFISGLIYRCRKPFKNEPDAANQEPDSAKSSDLRFIDSCEDHAKTEQTLDTNKDK